MPATVTVTGNLGRDPEVRFTAQGRQVTELQIAATPSHHDKTTNQWVDDGDPLWIKASFWDERGADLADTLRKGDRVAVTGTLMRRDYTSRDGRAGTSLELKFPTFLGVTPRKAQPGQPTGGSSSSAPRGYTNPDAQAAWNAPTGGSAGDPWATSDAPF